MSNVAIMEVPNGSAAPMGGTTVYHNGKQYTVFDGNWTGSTFIPSNNSMPYPTAPVQDLSPLYAKIGALEAEINGLNRVMVEYAEKVDLVFRNAEDMATKIGEWSREVAEAVDRRFDEIDQALRLLMDE